MRPSTATAGRSPLSPPHETAEAISANSLRRFNLTPERIASLSEAICGTARTVTTAAPFTGQLLARFRQPTTADVAPTYAAAATAQRRWAAHSTTDRSKPFVALHDLALGNRELMDIIQAEAGKARNSAFEETADIAGLALYYGRHAAKLLAPRNRKGAIPLATRTQELRQPKGVVGIISPWNYPLSLGICDAIPALLAGNAVELTYKAMNRLRIH